MVSIIIPTFNSAKTISGAIESVISQKYRKIELILVDGLSDDMTVSIIKEIAGKDKRIRYISEKDKGPYDAMNKGLSMCKGQWVYFLGADDILINESILVELFEEGFLNQKKVFYGNVVIEGDTSWAKDQQVYDGEFDLPKFLKKNICHQAIFYPRKTIERAGFFNNDYTVCADWDYNMRCYAIDPFLYTGKIIARFRGGGISTIMKDDQFLADLPGNIVRCFRLNPDDPELIRPDSPFRKTIEDYKKQKTE